MGHHRKVIIYDNHQESHLAINEDGAISEDGRPSSIGVIIHDSNGHVTAAMSKGLPAQFPVESIAIAIGFLIDQELKVSKVIVESNALSIIQSVNAKDSWCPWPYLSRDSQPPSFLQQLEISTSEKGTQ